MHRFIILTLCAFFVSGLIFLDQPAMAARPKYLFKIASLAPDGSVWTKRFNDFTDEVKQKANGEIGFKVYPGGVMGDDRSMYRKMRVGQIQAGGFTMTGIGEVVEDFRVLGTPFLFDSYQEVDYVLKGLMPALKQSFDEKGLVLMGFTEVGFLYGMSVQPLIIVDDLRKAKSWIPEGDPVSHDYFKEIGISPIQLAIPDVLTSLQTGLIDTVFNSFYGAIVLQWFTRINYITDIPFAYSYGALVFDKKAYAKLPASHTMIMENAVDKHFKLLMQDTRTSNENSFKVLQENGIKLVTTSAATKKELKTYRDNMIDKLIDKAFSRSIYDKTVKLIAEYRNKH